jgi:TfoX/Sxy family transcriptional regulator of competence genes
MGKRAAASMIPADRLAAYERMVASQPDVERKGATMPYTSLNGNMFSFLAGDGTIALRLGADERRAFMDAHAAQLFETHGTVMKEYVSVPAELIREPDTLATWFAASYRHARSLKPKPTRQSR